jgi:hypothetical protein
VAPELSPDGGTTTSTNSTSPALSSTLSESSSMIDVNIIQQQQQQHQQIQNNSTPQHIQVVRTNHRNDQQSPGQPLKLPDQLLESNAFANKTEPSISNNLIIIANEHKELSCSIGDENIVNHVSNTHNIVDNKLLPESEKNSSKALEQEQNSKASNANDKDNTESKTSNLSVASNIANAFINLSNLSSTSKNVIGNNVVKTSKNLNVIATQQQITQHFMKTLSFTTSRGGIIVPNVIATNITPQFTVHQYGLHGNPNGPAPNVTVNPNGNFNTNSNAIRPGAANHFRLLFQQTSNMNLNIVNNQNPSLIQSPILEASLQSSEKGPVFQQAPKVISTQTLTPSAPQVLKTQTSTMTQNQTLKEEHPLESSQIQDTSNVNSDQHIRVLTPSEIMKTLPSLSSQDNLCFNSSSSIANEKNLIQTYENKSTNVFSQTSETSSTVVNNSFKNSTNSSPLTTSECNILSSNFVSTKATMSSNNAQIQMVSGYKTYKNIFETFLVRCVLSFLIFTLTFFNGKHHYKEF